MSRRRRTRPTNPVTPNPEKTDTEARAILLQAMADCGATPAAVYAFHKTGMLLTEENVSRFSGEDLRAWNDAINEYEALAGRRNIVV
jgi:hypothetical protein